MEWDLVGPGLFIFAIEVLIFYSNNKKCSNSLEKQKQKNKKSAQMGCMI